MHTQFGFVYIFNLVIGVGALSLPKAFSQAGLVLGTLLLFMLAFMSYMTATFMIEAMAAANAIFRYERKRGLADSSKLSSLRPKTPDIQRVDDVSVCVVCGGDIAVGVYSMSQVFLSGNFTALSFSRSETGQLFDG